MIREHNKKDPKKERAAKLEYAKQYQRKKAQEREELNQFLDKLALKKKNKIVDYIRNVVLPTLEKM